MASSLKRVHLLIRSNWISSLGAACATLALIGEITAYSLHSTGNWGGPYLGIVTILVLPALFLGGLLFIPVGLLVYRSQLKARVASLADRPMALARAVAFLTLINFAAVASVGYKGAHHMSSVQFCGTTCHVMDAEFRAYQRTPHARVECVDCHVGDGADWYIKSKLNGVKQLIGTLRDDYSRPIPTPIHMMRPASETCATCHWPEKHLGSKLLVRTHFNDDAANTYYTNVLLMRRGGTRPNGKAEGIHWHSHPDTSVEYVSTDEKRMDVPWMKVTYPDGRQDVFARAGVDHDQPPEGHLRRMDCTDCHNRAAHAFQTAEEVVDQALEEGLVSRSLPFIHRNALSALKGDYTREQAPDGIRQSLQAAYTANGGMDETTRQRLEGTIKYLTEAWLGNVYPDRKLTWGTYPSLKGHLGCMRCHDGQHRNRDGKVIVNDCNACHVVLSTEESHSPMLETLGVDGSR